MYVFALFIRLSFIAAKVGNILLLPLDPTNVESNQSAILKEHHSSSTFPTKTLENDAENAILQGVSSSTSPASNKIAYKHLTTTLNKASLNADTSFSTTALPKISKMISSTPINDIKTLSTFDWRTYASIASKWIHFRNYSEVTEEITTDSTTEFSTLYETTYDISDTTQLLDEIAEILGEEENRTDVIRGSELTEGTISTLIHAETSSVNESNFTIINDETTVSIAKESPLMLNETKNLTISENFTTSTAETFSSAIETIDRKLELTGNSNSKNVLIGTDEINSLVTQTDDTVTTSSATAITTSQVILTSSMSTELPERTSFSTLTATNIPISKFTEKELSSTDTTTSTETSESVSIVTESSTLSSITTPFAATSFNWRTFLPTNMFKPTAAPVVSTSSTNNPFNQRHRYDMPERNYERRSPQSLISIVTITLTVTISCVLLTIFAIQRYRNHQLDDSSVSLMSSRRGRARTYYYDTSI